MSWKEKMREFGGGDLTFLTSDGEILNFVVCGEPVLLQGRYKGQATEKIGCPVMTEDGFMLLIAGKRLARKISKFEEHFSVSAFQAIRHGEEGDINATYGCKILDDVDMTTKLLTMMGTEFKLEMIEPAIAAAKEVLKQ